MTTFVSKVAESKEKENAGKEAEAPKLSVRERLAMARAKGAAEGAAKAEASPEVMSLRAGVAAKREQIAKLDEATARDLEAMRRDPSYVAAVDAAKARTAGR